MNQRLGRISLLFTNVRQFPKLDVNATSVLMRTGSRSISLITWGAPAFPLYQNRIRTLSETAIGVVRRAKSRFPRLLERLRKHETEWTVWKRTSRAQGSGPSDICHRTDATCYLHALHACCPTRHLSLFCALIFMRPLCPTWSGG